MIVLFAGLFAITLAVLFVLITRLCFDIARQQTAAELETTERVFYRLLVQREQRLIQAANVLTADFGFLQAVTSNDHDTTLSALENHGRRINADLMTLIGLDRRLLADTLHPDSPPHQSPFVQLIVRAERDGTASGIVHVDQALYQMVVVPVMGPELKAWVALGFVIDEHVVNDLQALAAVDVTFVARGLNDVWNIYASTLPASMHGALLSQLSRSHDGAFSVGEFTSLFMALGPEGSDSVGTVLQRSVNTTLARFDKLRAWLGVITVLSMVAVVLTSIVIARGITRPINALASVARRLQEGDYSEMPETGGTDEIGAFAATFNHMHNAIAKREAEIKRLAYEDRLTGFPNRILFYERLRHFTASRVESGGQFIVVTLGINRFRAINDTLGHEAGDQVLKCIAARLHDLFRGSDMIARLGGDEFGILVAAGGEEQFELVAARAHLALEEPIVVNGEPVDVTCSIGGAIFPTHGDTAGLLLRRSDIAMSSAKASRRSHALYDINKDKNRQEHLSLLGDLRQAIEDNELSLVFQPKIDLATGSVAGVESLIRWQHRRRGFLSPAEFIPFAESTGAIRLVTRWVIQAVIRQCAFWAERGSPLPVAFNVSARDLLDADLPKFIAATLEAHAVEPALIGIEITESALMEEPERAQSTVRELSNLGVNLAIDDYGTGYSSLAYLRELPINEIKIDRAFVTRIATGERDAAIVQATIGLGHRLGVKVLAEGVEDQESMDTLRRLGCDQVQGYFISRPLSADVLLPWVQRSRAKIGEDGGLRAEGAPGS
jgi:diguanylate cyclase (GGDEF)-like protein